LSESVAVIDPHSFRILDVNRVFLEWSGRSKEDIIGKTCYEITHQRTAPCAGQNEECPIPKMLETRTACTAEHVHTIGELGKQHVEIAASPVF